MQPQRTWPAMAHMPTMALQDSTPWTYRPLLRSSCLNQAGQYQAKNSQDKAHCTTGLRQIEVYPYIAMGQNQIPFDLRTPPREYEPQQYEYHCGFAVLREPSKRLRLVCPNFPWTIEIQGEWPVCCVHVWEALYESLQKPIKSSEWALIVHDENKKREIQRACRKRLEKHPDDNLRPRRIDWLGEMTLFRGLYRDEAFEKTVLVPGKDTWAETYVIRLDSHWPRV